MISAAADAELPQRQMAVGEGDVDSEALTRDGIAADGFADSLPLTDGDLQGPLKETWNATLPPLAPPPSSAEPAPVGDLPPVAWQSASSARTRQIAGIAALSTITLLIAAGIFTWIVRSWKAGQQNVVQASENPTPLPAVEASNHPLADNNDPLLPADTDSSRTEQPTDSIADDAPAVDDAGEAGAETNGELDGSSQQQIDPSVSTANEPPTEPATTSLPDVDSLFPDTPNPLIGGEANGSGEEGFANELPAELQKYAPQKLFDDPAAIASKNPLAAPPTMEELRVQMPQLDAIASQYPPPSPRIDVARALRVEAMGIQVQDQPLDRVVLVLSQLSGVPIEIDLLGIDVTGLRANQPISFVDKSKDAKTLLVRATGIAGFGLGANNGIVQVIPGTAATSETLQRAFSLSDLGTEPGITAEELQRLLASDGEAAKIAIEKDSCLVDGPLGVKLRAALMLEGVRKARGLAGVLPDSINRWIVSMELPSAGALGFGDWRPVDDIPVKYNAYQAEPVEVILQQLARDAGATLVFDWSSSWEHGLTPANRVLPWYGGRKVSQVVDEILEPYGMVLRDAGYGVWWVGTEVAYQAMPVVLIVSPGERDVDTVVAQVAAAAGVSSETGPIWHDEVSGKVIAYIPRYVVRELPRVLQ